MSERAIRAQGLYYLLGGLWPFAHWRSFVAVAGPKPDRFQTEVAAALFAAAGAGLLAGVRRAPASPAIRVLAAATGGGTTVLDLRHRRVIRRVFLVDAALNTAFTLAALRPRVLHRPERVR